MVVEGQLLLVGAALSHVIASTSSCSSIHALVYLSGTSAVYIDNKGNRSISVVPFFIPLSCVCLFACLLGIWRIEWNSLNPIMSIFSLWFLKNFMFFSWFCRHLHLFHPIKVGLLFLQKVWEAMVYQMTLSNFQTMVLGTLLVQSWLFIVLGGQWSQANTSWALIWCLIRR